MHEINVFVWKLRRGAAIVGSTWKKIGRGAFMGHGAIYSWGHSSFVGERMEFLIML